MMEGHEFEQWLLEAETPSIRYLTMTHLLEMDRGLEEVRRAKEAIMTHGPAPGILSAQGVEGNWPHERSYYTPKYTSTHWSMTLLAELHADGSSPGMQRGAESMLQRTESLLQRERRNKVHGFTCFWGNLLRYALHCGLEADARVMAICAHVVEEATQAEWTCEINNDLPCAWGAVRALWGLARLPAAARSPAMGEAIQSGLRFLLEEHALAAADYPTSGTVHPIWFRLNFPLFYQADILFVLRVLHELGALQHAGAEEALAWLKGRRGLGGRWRGASPFRRRTWKVFGGREESDRWASWMAATVLKSAGRA
jgi:hypothetical protein